jgi:hypothetical protein
MDLHTLSGSKFPNMKFLFYTGMAIPIIYISLYLLGGALRTDYSHISNSVSELLSPGSPSRPLLVTIQLIYALLHITFGLGVVWFFMESGTDRLTGLIGSWSIIALGIVTIGTAIFPQDAEGSALTMAGQIHKILVFGGLIPLSILSTLLLGLWFKQTGLLPGFALYSFITVAAVIVMGGVGGAMVETQYAGIVERVAAVVTQQWLFVLGLKLLFN